MIMLSNNWPYIHIYGVPNIYWTTALGTFRQLKASEYFTVENEGISSGSHLDYEKMFVCKKYLDKDMIAWAQRRGLPSSIGERNPNNHSFFLIPMKFKLQKSANFLHTKYLTHKLMCFVICIPLREHVSCLCLPTVWSTSPGLLVWPPPFSSPPTSGPLSE